MRRAIPSREASRIVAGDVIEVLVDGVPTRLEVLEMRPVLEQRWLVVEVPDGVRVGEIERIEKATGEMRTRNGT